MSGPERKSRKRSPLAGDGPAWMSAVQPAEPDPPVPPVDSVLPDGHQSGQSGDGHGSYVPGNRKRTTGGAADPFELKSFNCKLTVVMRRLTRTYAARHDRDLQDVVAQALTEFLEREGVQVPRTQEEYADLVAAGKL